ncbi:HAD family phosphatase [Peribacillus saganii]|uniref:HAD family phosphatase n=1 Tax=Peribacillus saganii TaxID=2303992 RepID=A0A372LP51_9BACI|nr:HAD family hydrolase [Peribacillus saganii]RFU69514.1 HAD family phosphatase [Peribacillus saganii]
MKYKMIVFDLDGTLAEAGKGIERHVANQIKDLEEMGYTIVFNSGKNAAYLSGFARGIGISRPIVIGENGSILLYPFENREIQLVERGDILDEIKEKVLETFTDKVWLQPNQVALTFFPKNREHITELSEFMSDLVNQHEDGYVMYTHIDAIDIIPKNVHKGVSMLELFRQEKITKDEVIAVGDSTNDIPMLTEAGLSIIIGNKLKLEGAKQFDTIEEALEFIKRQGLSLGRL